MAGLLSDLVKDVSHTGIGEIPSEDVERKTGHEDRLEPHTDARDRSDLLA